jgi:hypothetical protein
MHMFTTLYRHDACFYSRIAPTYKAKVYSISLWHYMSHLHIRNYNLALESGMQ